MVTLKAYNYTGKPNQVGKVLPKHTEYKGTLIDAFDVLRPVVRFRSPELVAFNYVYIESLHRYYFVESLQQHGDTCTVNLRVDVLETYRDAILQSKGTLVRGENTDAYLSNRQNVVDTRANIRKLDFPVTGLVNENGSIIMVTIKGNV